MAHRQFMKEAREKLNLSQQKLADDIEISQTAIAAYESGTRRPKFEVAIRLAEKLGIDWQLFFQRNAS